MANTIAPSDFSDRYKQLWDFVCGCIWHLNSHILDQKDVEDLAQKTLLDTQKWFEKQPSPPELQDIHRYASTAGKRNFLHWKRDKTRQQAALETEGELWHKKPEQPDETLLKKEWARLLHQAIAVLPETLRQVVFLYYFEGLSIKEVAVQLGIKESAAKQTSRDNTAHTRNLRNC